MKIPKYEIADILEVALEDKILSTSLNAHVKKSAKSIIRCRTAALGGHKLICSKCQHVEISYNSCRNRHCPKCQFGKQLQWVADQERCFLPVRYAHVIFTLPDQLNCLAKAEPEILYNTLFQSAWQTIKSLAQDPKWIGANPGMTASSHPPAVRSLKCPLDICPAYSRNRSLLHVGPESILASPFTLHRPDRRLGS